MQGFRSSINLHFDLPNPKLLGRLILSPSHCEVMREVIGGLQTEGTHAHLLIGPYGTGKSLLATVTCQLLSRQFPDEWCEGLLDQAERLDSSLAAHIREFRDDSHTFIPVIINGKSGSLRNIINRAVYRALHFAGVSITTPNEVSSILNTVERWRLHYPDAFDSLLRHMEELGVQEQEWIALVEGYHEETIRQFEAFYPSVTSGTPWSIEQDDHFVDNLVKIVAELKEHGQGLFIVYDEFGRFLQALEGLDTLRNMQDLQDFAEFVNHSDNIHLLVIGHQHIRQYAVNSREAIRTEFEKVEKRFRFYSLETDAATYLRIAQEAGTELNGLSLSEKVVLETLGTLQSYPLFAEYTTYQLESIILHSLYPVHPVAVALLPSLSNIFGQNERTLFTFFSDTGCYGLRDHIHRNQGYYYADQLFNFFDIGQADHKDQPSLQLYHRIAPYLDHQDRKQRRIVKLLTLWRITRLSQKQPVTTSFLSFALGITPNETMEVLERLSKAKIIRHNRIREQWELFDGSSVDLNSIIAEKLTGTQIANREGLEMLEQHMPTSYILPYEYNDEVDMLRYAEIRFVGANQLALSANVESMADDQVWLVVFDQEEQLKETLWLRETLNIPNIVAYPAFTSENVRKYLIQYKVIHQLLHDSIFLAQDTRLKNELSYMLQDTSGHIRSFVERYFAFQDLEWRSGNEQMPIRNMRELEDCITERLRDKYPQTPQIRNEAFNRNHISSVQKRALVDVIDRLILQPGEPNLGITGHGPNYLIYASVLKNNDFKWDEEGAVQCNDSLTALRDELLNHLANHPTGSLTDLVQIFAGPPYGIRAAVIPVLFVALLRDRWEQLLFYSHDMLITHLSGVSVVELLEHSEAYEYRYFNLTVEEKGQLLELSQYFMLPAEASTSFLLVAGGLLRWLRALPKFTQITQQVSDETQQVRTAIRASEIDPYLYVKQLASMGTALVRAKEEMEQYLHRNELELEREILAVTGKTSSTQFFEEMDRYRVEVIGMNSKLLTMQPDQEEEWIDRLAEHLVGVARTEWSDATQDLFLRQVKYEWQLLSSEQIAATSTEGPIGMKLPMTKKSQLLYTNVKNLLKYAGKDVSVQEIKQLLSRLMQEI